MIFHPGLRPASHRQSPWIPAPGRVEDKLSRELPMAFGATFGYENGVGTGTQRGFHPLPNPPPQGRGNRFTPIFMAMASWHRGDGLELGFGALVGFDSLLEGAELPVQFVDLPVLHAVVEQIAGGAHAQDRVGVLDGNPGEDVEALGNQGLDLHQGDFVSVLAQAV